jgi:hypothetical protein
MPDQQEKTSGHVLCAGIPNREELADLEKLEAEAIYDLINQIIHDTAHAWQLFAQGDPEEGLTVLHSIRDRCNEIEMVLEDCRIASPATLSAEKEAV